MQKRPTIRQRFPPTYSSQRHDVKPGTFLYDIVNPPPVRHYTYTPQPVYRKQDYLRLLAKNRVELGLEPKEINITTNKNHRHSRLSYKHINPLGIQMRFSKK